jgi:hypothetical protein
VAGGGRNDIRPVPQLASVPFGAGVVVPVLFCAESAELAVVLFRVPVPVALFCALAAVVLADPVVVRLAAVVRGAVRAGVLFAAVRVGAVLSAAFAAVLPAAFAAVLSAAFAAVLSADFGAAVTAGVLGSLSVTASCHALRLGTSGELSRKPGRSGAVAFIRSSVNLRWLASSCSARWYAFATASCGVGSLSANGKLTCGSLDGSLGAAVRTVSSQVLTAAIMASWLFRVAARTSSCVGMLAMS